MGRAMPRPEGDATERITVMSPGLVSFLLLVLIFFCFLYLIWMLPVSWRVRQIIQVVAVIIALVYLFQHPRLLPF